MGVSKNERVKFSTVFIEPPPSPPAAPPHEVQQHGNIPIVDINGNDGGDCPEPGLGRTSLSTKNNSSIRSALNLGNNSQLIEANYTRLIKSFDGLTFEADGFVAFELTLLHDNNFDINLTNSAFIASSNTTGNTTKVVVINNTTNELFTSSSDYEIVDVVAGTANGIAVHVDIIELPRLIKLNKAFPNPFNPITTLSFELPFDQKVSINIYDVNGRVVTSLAEGYMTAGYHSIKWDAGNYSSSLYFVSMEAENFVDTQKLLLIK